MSLEIGQMAGTANINVPGAPNYPLPGGAAIGTIPGGALRPGAIDQARFQQLLLAQSQAQNQAQTQLQGQAAGTQIPVGGAPKAGMTLDDYRKLAGAPSSVAPPAQPLPEGPPPSTPIGSIPNLTAEQFAVLTGMNLVESAPTEAIAPEMPDTIVSGAPAAPGVPTELGVASETAVAEAAAQTAAIDPAASADPAADPAADADPSAQAAAPASREEKPSGEEGDDRVVWFDSMPDRDDRRRIMASGKQVRIRETPGAKELFLGPDGKFGWDDALDIINPLQHIPIVAQAYRAISGDQAYGLSQFAGAVPFGPLSIASAVIDTVVRSETGRDAGTDIAAAILGIDNRTPEEANLHLVTQPSENLATAPAEAEVVQEATVDDGPAWMQENRLG